VLARVSRKLLCYTVKAKLSLYIPWSPLGLWKVEASTFSGIRLTRRPPLPPRNFLVLISIRGWVDPRSIVQLEILGKLKKFTSSGTGTGDLPACSTVPEPATLPRTPCYTVHTRNTQFCLPKWRQRFVILHGNILESRIRPLNSIHESRTIIIVEQCYSPRFIDIVVQQTWVSGVLQIVETRGYTQLKTFMK
jgi:hypothetical protein